MRKAEAERRMDGFCKPCRLSKTFRVVWRAEALRFQIESGDMRGGFVRLAQQAFLTLFPAWEIHRGERETALYTRKRMPQADFFDICKPCSLDCVSRRFAHLLTVGIKNRGYRAQSAAAPILRFKPAVP